MSTSSEEPTTMRAASRVLDRIAFGIATDLGATRAEATIAVERVQDLLRNAERDGDIPRGGVVPVVLLLASIMLEELAEGGA